MLPFALAIFTGAFLQAALTMLQTELGSLGEPVDDPGAPAGGEPVAQTADQRLKSS